MKKVLTILILSGLLLLSFAFTPTPNLVWGLAQITEPVSPPETLEEARKIGERTLETILKELPGILERIWKEEVLPVWKSAWNWAKNWWRNTIWPWIRGFWEEKIKPPLGEEVEKRKGTIEEGLEREKEELKEEASKVGKSLWEKFKELIK